MENFDVIYRDKQIGSVERYQDGLFTVLSCKCTYFQEPVRLYGYSEKDYFDIGVLIPSNGNLCLTKKYSRLELHRLPVDTCTRFEVMDINRKPKDHFEIEAKAVLTQNSERTECKPEAAEVMKYPITNTESKSELMNKPQASETMWQPVDDPSALFADPELVEVASTIRGGLTAIEGDIVLFAIPVSSEHPFPLMPVFRYGSSAMIEGKCCIVFQIRDGYLI